MFIRSLLISLGLLALFTIPLVVQELKISQDDKTRYFELLTESQEIRSKKVLEKKPGVQLREKVAKTIWTLENGSRQPIQIFAKRSELTLFETKKSFEITEKLFGIEAWMEDGKRLFAKNGIFSYPEQRFTAYDATLKIEPNGIVFTPEMQIISSNKLKNAQIVCIDPKGTIQATHFSAKKMILYPNQETIELFDSVCLKTNDHFSIFQISDSTESNFAIAQGERAVLSENNAVLEENVYLQAFHGKGFADKLTFDFETKMIHLSATPPKRVLFCKQEMRLSAPEISMDLTTETIKGNQDVRFSFTLEEENEIDKLLQRFSPT